MSNDGTEAINMLVEKARGLAQGYRKFDNCRLRMLLTACGIRTRGASTGSPWPRSSPKSPGGPSGGGRLSSQLAGP